MKFALIGRTHILLKAAEELERGGHQCGLVITAKEAPEYSARDSDYERFAAARKIPFFNTSKINSLAEELAKIVAKAELAVGVSMNYVSTIESTVISQFKCGLLNLHMGDLPRYRGNATPNWLILNQESKATLCVHKMIGGELDSGDIVARESVQIDENTTVTHLYTWMESIAPALFLRALDLLNQNGSFVLEAQSKDPSRSLRCYPRTPSDRQLDWHQSNRNILALIDASTAPFAGAYTFLDKMRVTIWKANIENDPESFLGIPGQIASINKGDGSIVVLCQSGKIRVWEIETSDFRGRPAEVLKSTRQRFCFRWDS